MRPPLHFITRAGWRHHCVKVDAYLRRGGDGQQNRNFGFRTRTGALPIASRQTRGKSIAVQSYVLVVGTYDKTAMATSLFALVLWVLLAAKTTRSMGGHAVYTGSNNSNFCINEGLDANATFFRFEPRCRDVWPTNASIA